MIMRKIEKGEGKGTAKVWSYPGMEKLVQTLRKNIEKVSELFTLDACRHGGMTELEEAELTEGQGRAGRAGECGAAKGEVGHGFARGAICNPAAVCTVISCSTRFPLRLAHAARLNF
jgi:hypothetical protein